MTSPLERHYTPPELAHALAHRAIFPSGGVHRVLEPSAGSGSISAAVRNLSWGLAVDEYDLDPDLPPRAGLVRADFLRVEPATVRYDLVIGNPPYALAVPFIDHAQKFLAPGGRLLFLLRLTFLATKYGAALAERWKPAEVWPIVGRPTFTGPDSKGHTGKSEMCAILWNLEPARDARVNWLRWRA
jgi:tRNA1(Val) A37 N6-methylase TrmN6